MFGAFGDALTETSFNFVSKYSVDSGVIDSYGLKKNAYQLKDVEMLKRKI